MRYIEYLPAFEGYMIENGPHNEKSRKNYISWLLFLSESGFNIDSQLDDNETIISSLREGANQREKYSNDKDYSNFRSALNKYRDFIADYLLSLPSLLSDLHTIDDDNLNETERMELRKARVGQGKFRDELTKQWGFQCSVTSIDKVEFLIASHIVPWRKCDNADRLNKHNGLLLAPNYDKLFDKGYISFQDNCEIILSSNINQKIFESMGIAKSNRLRFVDNNHKPFLARHRDIFYRTLYN